MCENQRERERERDGFYSSRSSPYSSTGKGREGREAEKKTSQDSQ